MAQVGAGPEKEDQRMEESAESLKVQRAGSGGKDSGRGVWWCEELSRRTAPHLSLVWRVGRESPV